MGLPRGRLESTETEQNFADVLSGGNMERIT
jgi:hypothetical protein